MLLLILVKPGLHAAAGSGSVGMPHTCANPLVCVILAHLTGPVSGDLWEKWALGGAISARIRALVQPGPSPAH